MALPELVIPVSSPAPRDTMSSGFGGSLSNFDYGSYASDANLGNPDTAFVSPGVPPELLPEVVTDVATTVAQDNPFLLPLIALFYPTDAGPAVEDVSGPKFQFDPAPPLDEVTIEGSMRIGFNPPPIDTAPPVITFPPDPPNWWDLATEPTDFPFGKPEWLPGPGIPLPFVPGLYPNAAPDNPYLTPVEVPGGKPSPTPSDRPDARPDRTPGVSPLPGNPLEFPVPGGYPAPDRTVAPTPDLGPQPHGDPGLDPFGDPRTEPTPETQPRPRTDAPANPRLGTPDRFANPFLDPFNPLVGDPTTPVLDPLPDPTEAADPCGCTPVKRGAPGKKKKKKRDKDKCYLYTNRQYSDGTVRVTTKEIPCEPRASRHKQLSQQR